MEDVKEIPEFAKERLSYNHLTGVFTWSSFNKHHPRLTGTQAGSFRENKNGEKRLVIKLNGVAYFAHRLDWFIYYNEQPKIIDHINGNTLDNRILNLRSVTVNENAKNHGKKLNKSGLPCGVRMLPSGKYQSRISCDNKIITVGTFDSVEAANSAYISKRNELFKEYSRGFKNDTN